jgi:hypothetical protein
MNATRQSCTRASWRNISAMEQHRMRASARAANTADTDGFKYLGPLQQPQPSHSIKSTRFATGVRGASAPDLPPSTTLNSGVTAPKGSMETGNSDSPGNYTFGLSPDFTFGTTEQDGDLMDFKFDTITAPGNDEMLAAMQAIQSPTLVWEHVDARVSRRSFSCCARQTSYILTD